MEFFSFIVAICLLVVALLCIVYLGSLMLGPFVSLIRGGKENAKVRKAAQKMERVDALIAEHKCVEALKSLRKTVMYDGALSPTMIEALKDHNQNILSRCLVIAEELGSRATNIAEVERLFSERGELQLLFLKASESYRSLKFRREKAGKPIPVWSKADFEKRLVEIRKELRKNEQLLETALDKLFAALENPSAEGIVYH